MIILITRTVGIKRLKKDSFLVTNSNIINISHQAASHAGISPVLIMKNPGLKALCTAGILKALIFIPMSMLSGVSEEILFTLFLHEYFHIKNRDVFAEFLCGWVRALYFYNPIIAVFMRLHREEREIRCDYFTADSCTTPKAYAQILYQWAMDSMPPEIASGIGGGGRSVIHRIERLFETPKRFKNSMRFWPALLVFVLLLLLVVGSCTGIKAGIDTATHQITINQLSKPFSRMVFSQPLEFELVLHSEEPLTGDQDLPVVLVYYWVDSRTTVTDTVEGVLREDGSLYYYCSQEDQSPDFWTDQLNYYVFAPDWVPIFSAQLSADDEGKLKVENSLEKGEPFSLRITDPRGQSIEEVSHRDEYQRSFGELEGNFDQGEFRFSSLLLGAEYTLRASVGCSEPLVRRFKIQEEETVQIFPLEFTRYPDLKIVIVDQLGRELFLDNANILSENKDGGLCTYSFSGNPSNWILFNYQEDYYKRLELQQPGRKPIDLLSFPLERDSNGLIIRCVLP